MASAELYDYLATITPDYTATTLTIVPQGVVSEESSKPHAIHIGADGSEERISFSTTSIFYLSVGWNILSQSDSGTIFDFYNDSAKADGCKKSFYLTYGDGHTYVVRFDSILPRQGTAVTRYGFPDVRFRVLGRKSD